MFKILFSSVLTIVFLHLSLVCVRYGACQFPSVCNTPENIDNKVCCPNDCGNSLGRGACRSVVSEASTQAANASSAIVEILQNTLLTDKGALDTRYKWPTVVFERVCRCNSRYYGADCSECAFGWTGSNCQTPKSLVTRKSFSNLSESEKRDVIEGFRMLKRDMGYWSVIVAEPTSTSNQVTLQNVSTYDYLIYIHNYATRDGSEACRKLNNLLIDFAHSGPNFPVWHRTYLLILEGAMQRVLNNDSFGLPYWSWETNDKSPFNRDYFGSMPNVNGSKDVMGNLFNNWTTICDVAYRNSMSYRKDKSPEICAMFWTVCNPKSYLSMNENNKVQRGNNETYYLPGVREIQIALAAPNYDSPPYNKNSSDSFRNRMEGWNRICSGQEAYIGDQEKDDLEWRLHNVVHFWVGGHMRNPPSTVNDPIFSLHHANIDRIFESWIDRFTRRNQMIPEYLPESGGHPGHNKGDYMVPFFPLITPGGQYSPADNWGYEYDYVFNDNIQETDIKKTPDSKSQCFICTAENSCVCRKQNNMPGFEVCKNCSPDITCPIDPNPTRQSSSGKLDSTYILYLFILAPSIIAILVFLLIYWMVIKA